MCFMMGGKWEGWGIFVLEFWQHWDSFDIMFLKCTFENRLQMWLFGFCCMGFTPTCQFLLKMSIKYLEKPICDFLHPSSLLKVDPERAPTYAWSTGSVRVLVGVWTEDCPDCLVGRHLPWEYEIQRSHLSNDTCAQKIGSLVVPCKAPCITGSVVGLVSVHCSWVR